MENENEEVAEVECEYCHSLVTKTKTAYWYKEGIPRIFSRRSL